MPEVFAVAPYVGAWIEMPPGGRLVNKLEVAPYVGAWIEIGSGSLTVSPASGRSLRGGVD